MEEMNCPVCKNLGYVFLPSGQKVPCLCLRFKYLSNYLGERFVSLFKLACEDTALLEKIFGEKHARMAAFLGGTISPYFIDSFVSYFLLSQGCPKYVVLNAYELIEVFLGRHPNYNSIFNIESDAFILLSGFHEFPNVRQNDIVFQFLDLRRESKFLFLFRGNSSLKDAFSSYKDSSWFVYDSSNIEAGDKVDSYERI